MSDKISVLRTALQKPDMGKILVAASAYAFCWQRKVFSFLPLLHESIERHQYGLNTHSEGFARNAEILWVSIKSENIEALLSELLESAGDPDEEAFFFEEIQRSARNIGVKLNALLVGVVDASESVRGLPVYDVERDRADYMKAKERLDSAQQDLEARLSVKRQELGELESVIDAFEANGLDKMFEGKLPTTQQLQELVALGTTPAAVVVAVEKGLEAINKLMGGVLEGMRYSKLQEQFRATHGQVKEMIAEQREKSGRAIEVQSYLNALEEYYPLNEKRQDWLGEKNQIRLQLESARNQLRSIRIKNIENVKLLHKLLLELSVYVHHVVMASRESY